MKKTLLVAVVILVIVSVAFTYAYHRKLDGYNIEEWQALYLNEQDKRKMTEDALFLANDNIEEVNYQIRESKFMTGGEYEDMEMALDDLFEAELVYLPYY